MEHGQHLPAASTRKNSATKASPSDSTFQSQSTNDTSENNLHPFQISPLENRAIELYCEILLSRAHFLLFNSIRVKDADDQVRLSNQGKDALETAESICMAGQYSVSDQTVAKCWYVRGFCDDVSGNQENASACFDHATSLDEYYLGLKRVEYYRLHRDIEQDLYEEWERPDRPIEYGNAPYRFGEVNSVQKKARRASTNSHGRPKSELFNNLMFDVTNAPRSPTRGSEEAVPPSPTVPTHVNHSPPIAAPSHAGESEFDKVINQILEKPSKAATRRPSEDILSALREHENSPKKDKMLLLVAQRQAELEAAERAVRAREARQIQQYRQVMRIDLPPKRAGRPITQETLLSDTPSVEELDTPSFSPADRSAGSPKSPTMTVTTQGFKRLSVSASTGLPSPVPSSPLRKCSLPGERDSDEPSEL